MKYWRGYLTAAVFAAITWAMMELGTKFGALVDMIYPYVIRTGQTMLATWSSSVEFVLWQVLAIGAAIVLLATLVLMIVLKWNPIQWLGWVLAAVAGVFMLNTLVFGLNHYAGPLAEDIRLEVVEYNLDELTEAAIYYRDKANELSSQVRRDGNGNVDFADFDTLAEQAADGFQTLVYDRSFPVFAGTTIPVKELGWADWFTKRGITGITVGLTGESAVNPQIPDICLPFTISHEMSHRMCIAGERDGHFAAFLAGSVNESVEFQYSAYFMAYRFCYDVLSSSNDLEAAGAAGRVKNGVGDLLYQDMLYYDQYFSNTGSSAVSTTTAEVCDLLVSWHIQEVVLPSVTVEEDPFDPLDESQVDLSGIVNAKTGG